MSFFQTHKFSTISKTRKLEKIDAKGMDVMVNTVPKKVILVLKNNEHDILIRQFSIFLLPHFFFWVKIIYCALRVVFAKVGH